MLRWIGKHSDIDMSDPDDRFKTYVDTIIINLILISRYDDTYCVSRFRRYKDGHREFGPCFKWAHSLKEAQKMALASDNLRIRDFVWIHGNIDEFQEMSILNHMYL